MERRGGDEVLEGGGGVEVMEAPPSRLERLQLRDQDKAAKEHALNSLESHIFEMQDAVDSAKVVAVTMAEQRQEMHAALRAASDWMDEEGYDADTKVNWVEVVGV